MVFDTGVLVEIVNGSRLGHGLKPRLESGSLVPHLTDLNLFELSYLVCRRSGEAKAAEVIGSVRKAGYFEIHGNREFLEAAAKLKCGRALSVVDCVTIAAGESLGMPVLFATRERELDAELKARPFSVELRFLTDSEPGPSGPAKATA
ncbi:MAG: PIN domain-containing protein [Thaumarchaeota archaeon]|nr:PIN domain-containing protein [Nitrososphaerota archaeon]